MEFIDLMMGTSHDISENGIVGTITISGEEGEALYNGRDMKPSNLPSIPQPNPVAQVLLNC